MKRFFKHLFTLIVISLGVYGGTAKADFVSDYIRDSLGVELNNKQAEIVKEIVNRYALSDQGIAANDTAVWKKKLRNALLSIRDGFKIYKIARDPDIEKRVQEFDSTTKINAYVLCYFEDAFVNDLFLSFAKAYYEAIHPTKYFIIKYKFTKAPNYSPDKPVFLAAKPSFECPDTIKNKLIAKFGSMDYLEGVSFGPLQAGLGTSTINKSEYTKAVFGSVDVTLSKISGADIIDLNSIDGVSVIDCSKESVTPKLKDLALRAKKCDWKVDDQIEEIKEDDFKGLCFEHRVDLLMCIGSFPSKDQDDITVLKLLRTTPVNERNKLLKWLYDNKKVEQLINRIDGDEFLEFIEILSSWKGKPTQANFEGTITSQNVLFFNQVDGFRYDFNEKGQMWFRTRENFNFFEYKQDLSCNPFDWMTVVFFSDFIIGGKKFNAGEIYTFTALEVYSIFNENDNKQIKLTASVLADIPLMFVGIGELRMAKNLATFAKVLKTAKGITTIAVASTGLAMALGLEDELTLTPGGKEILLYWTYFNLVYTGVTLTPVALRTANSLYASAKLFLKNPQVKTNIKAGVQKIIDDLKALVQKNGQKLDEVTSAWRARGLDKIDDWISAIGDASKKTNVENIISSWDDAVLQSLNTRLNDYAGLGEELAKDTKLLNYYYSLETNWWSKYALAGLSKRSTSKIPPVFTQMLGDIEITSMNIKLRLRTVSFDETNNQYIGKLFDEVVEDKIVRAWQSGDFSDFPQGLVNQLQQLKNQGYELATEVSVVINGKNPVPDLLFVKRELDPITNTYRYNTNSVKYIDTKYLWDSPFTSSQMEIVTAIKNNGYAVVRASNGVANIEEVQMILPNTPFRIISVEKLTVDQQLDLGIR